MCIRVEPQEGESLKTLRDRIPKQYRVPSFWPQESFLLLVKPTGVTAASTLALLRDGEWIVGGAEVRSAIGLPQLGDVIVDPHSLSNGDEVYVRSESVFCEKIITVPAVMYQVVGTLPWRAVAEEALKKPQELPRPCPAVLCAFIAKLARYEIAIVENIEDYLYYHVLVADHVKYFEYVGPPVPPSLITPALESPLRIPRILYAMFAVGSVWNGPWGGSCASSCGAVITVPDSWDSHNLGECQLFG